MDFDVLNKKYWAEIKSDYILSGVRLPGDELKSLLHSASIVLDVGCADGKVSEFLFKQGYQVTGVDINQSVILKNQLNNVSISYQYADITDAIPFADGVFDAVVTSFVFVSIIEPDLTKKAAEEIIRVLKPGGILWICEAIYSPDYIHRYKDGKNKTGLNNIAISYVKNEVGQEVESVKRVIKHYSQLELNQLFYNLTLISAQEVSEISPSSGMNVQATVSVYKKE